MRTLKGFHDKALTFVFNRSQFVAPIMYQFTFTILEALWQ
jgi:hypothetical protein